MFMSDYSSDKKKQQVTYQQPHFPQMTKKKAEKAQYINTNFIPDFSPPLSRRLLCILSVLSAAQQWGPGDNPDTSPAGKVGAGSSTSNPGHQVP